MKGILTLARRNFAAYKKNYIKIIVALVALLFLITLFCSFTVSLKAKQQEYLYQNISSNYVYGDRPLQTGEISESFTTLEVKRVPLEPLNAALFGEGFGKEFYPAFQRIAIDCQGSRHFYDEGTMDFIPYVAPDGAITPNDIKEAGGAELMIGRYPENAYEIVLTEECLNCYGLTRDILDKRVTFRAINFYEEYGGLMSEWTHPGFPSQWEYGYVELPFESEFTVCGNLTCEYTKLSGRFYGYRPTAIVTEYSVFASYGLTTEYVCSLDGWASNDTVKYVDGQQGIYYAGEDNVKMMDITAKMKLVSDRLALYFGSVLIFAVVFTLIMLTDRLCLSQMKNSGELLISGLTNRQLFFVWLAQFAIAALIALAAAIVLTVGSLYAVNAVLYDALSVRLDVSAGTFLTVSAIGLAVVAAVTVASLAYVAVKYKRKQTRELLDT